MVIGEFLIVNCKRALNIHSLPSTIHQQELRIINGALFH